MNFFVKSVMFMGACVATWACSNNLMSSSQHQYEKSNVETCEESRARVDIFYDNEIADFTFTRLAYVEVEADYVNESTETIMDRLKCEARRNCANGIINIRRELKRERIGGQFHNVTTLSGIAVTVDRDNGNYLSSNTTAIPQEIPKEKTENKRRDWANGIRVIVLSIIIIAATVGL